MLRSILVTVVVAGLSISTARLSSAEPSSPGNFPTLAGGQQNNLLLIEDESGRLAQALEPIFREAGFGVTRRGWDAVPPGSLKATHPDLVVLADARRLPAQLAAEVDSYVQAGGRLLALGAPAFGELLWKTPQGYVPQERYAAALDPSLAKQPLPLSAERWSRGSNNPKLAASIDAEDDAWRVTTSTLKGWEYFGHPVADPIPEDHGLLCFHARGDAQTPQIYVECTEKDQSRWVATIELSETWQPVILRAGDFTFWPDSPAQRGGPGDHVVFSNLRSIQLGMAQGQTPRCNAGPHTFWFRGLATAVDPNAADATVTTPELEGLSPSYALYPISVPLTLRTASDATTTPPGTIPSIPLPSAAYAPVSRETGIGFDRQRDDRWIRLLDGYDAEGKNRGALVWLMVGDKQLPGAVWGGYGLSDPSAIVEGPAAAMLQATLRQAAQRIARGAFLLEAGSRYFSYAPGEAIELGALVGNAGRRDQALSLVLQLTNAQGQVVDRQTTSLNLPAGKRQEITRTWTPPADTAAEFPYTIRVELQADGHPIDQITHRIDCLKPRQGRPEDFVRVEGSQFTLGGKPWTLRGINYWPNHQGGRASTACFDRAYYDPELIERDLAWLESTGINLLSGAHLSASADLSKPGVYRDFQDFVERADRHGMKLYCFLPWCNPMSDANVTETQRQIEAAGLREHPAILAWDLAWEPIYYAGPKDGQMDFLLGDWNTWIADRYGSLAAAEADWGQTLPRSKDRPDWATLPEVRWCREPGPWDRVVAAFRRFFSDRVGQGYGDVIRQMRRFDPNHLYSFRFGGCGIPEAERFAHCHSASVAKHLDFLCPEAYNLQTLGAGKVLPADAIRQGGLITRYYRFLSRNKPVVWMEFGFTLNDTHFHWKTSDIHLSAQQLADQRTEYENFYEMFLESGARGAAPWWYPGGYRLVERSDYGLVDPDGTERPAFGVLRESFPKFAALPVTDPVAQDGTPAIMLDMDAHYVDGYRLYSEAYLKAVQAGHVPGLRTTGTGTTSADCPLVAVGNTPLNGHNPPQHLNAEFNTVEIQVGEEPWREIARGQKVTLSAGQSLRCRASLGNIAEASWQTNGSPGEPGIVSLAARLEPSGREWRLPLVGPTPYLSDAQVAEFSVPEAAGQEKLTLQLGVVRTTAENTKR